MPGTALGWPDFDVPLGDQAFQVVAGHVRVDVEGFGDRGGGSRTGGLPNGEVDAATRRIPEDGGEIAECGLEVASIHRWPPDE